MMSTILIPGRNSYIGLSRIERHSANWLLGNGANGNYVQQVRLGHGWKLMIQEPCMDEIDHCKDENLITRPTVCFKVHLASPPVSHAQRMQNLCTVLYIYTYI